MLTKRAKRLATLSEHIDWPDNVWVGTSIESARQLPRADHLRRVDASVRFIAAEPLIGPLAALDLAGLHWLTVAGESGPGARPMKPEWVRDLRDAAVARDVPFFFLQWGGSGRSAKGRTLDGRVWEQRPPASGTSASQSARPPHPITSPRPATPPRLTAHAVLLEPERSTMFRRILVAFDDSPSARLGLEQAFDLSRAEHVEQLTVLSVLPPAHQLVALGGQDPEALHEQMRGELEHSLSRAATDAPGDVSVTTELVEGHPGDAVVHAATDGAYDLVVMGSRGRGAAASALLGSVSTHVVQRASMAVMVLHAPSTEAPPLALAEEETVVRS